MRVVKLLRFFGRLVCLRQKFVSFGQINQFVAGRNFFWTNAALRFRRPRAKVLGADATTVANHRLRAAICESNADPTRPDGCRRLRGALLNKAGRLLLGRDRSRNSTSSSARAFAKSTGATVAYSVAHGMLEPHVDHAITLLLPFFAVSVRFSVRARRQRAQAIPESPPTTRC